MRETVAKHLQVFYLGGGHYGNKNWQKSNTDFLTKTLCCNVEETYCGKSSSSLSIEPSGIFFPALIFTLSNTINSNITFMQTC